MSTVEKADYEKSLPTRAMEAALRANARMTTHEAVCAERYRWILLWVKATAVVVSVSAAGLIGAMYTLILRLEPLGH